MKFNKLQFWLQSHKTFYVAINVLNCMINTFQMELKLKNWLICLLISFFIDLLQKSRVYKMLWTFPRSKTRTVEQSVSHETRTVSKVKTTSSLIFNTKQVRITLIRRIKILHILPLMMTFSSLLCSSKIAQHDVYYWQNKVYWWLAKT